MTLAERGLFHTLRLECWENKQVPSNGHELAKYLGYDVSEIQKALSDNVKSFFVESNGLFTCPELEDYRQHLEDIKLKQSKGGKQGAAMTNAKLRTGKPSSNSQASRRGDDESLVKLSTEKQSQTQPLESGVNDEWVNEYDKASNGQ
jgi:hypothetical protein